MSKHSSNIFDLLPTEEEEENQQRTENEENINDLSSDVDHMKLTERTPVDQYHYPHEHRFTWKKRTIKEKGKPIELFQCEDRVLHRTKLQRMSCLRCGILNDSSKNISI